MFKATRGVSFKALLCVGGKLIRQHETFKAFAKNGEKYFPDCLLKLWDEIQQGQRFSDTGRAD